VKRKAREKELKADAERARQGKEKKKKKTDASNLDAYGNPRDVDGEAEDDAKWAAAFEREEREWQEGDVYDERTGKISAGRRRGAAGT
jgi:hypothetical protein